MASLVSNAIELEDIYLSKVNLDTNFQMGVLPDGIPFEMKIQQPQTQFELIQEKLLFVQVGIGIEFQIKADNQSNQEVLPKGNMEVLFTAKYKIIPEGPIPKEVEEEGFPAFAKFNGTFNCWPYIRQAIHGLSCDMGLPFILPLLKIETRTDEKPKKIEDSKKRTRKSTNKKGAPKKAPSDEKSKRKSKSASKKATSKKAKGKKKSK